MNRVHLVRKLGFHPVGKGWIVYELDLFEAAVKALNYYCRGWRRADLEVLSRSRIYAFHARRDRTGTIEFEYPA